MDELLNPKEVAALLKVAVGTLARWRIEGTGPPFRKIGDGKRPRIRYERSKVEAWSAK